MTIRGIAAGTNALNEVLEGTVEVSSRATPEKIWNALANLQTHLEWAGERQSKKMRLLSMDAPSGLAVAGTEFVTTGSDPNGMFRDSSVVIEATPGRVFEFVTESVLTPKRDGPPVEWTVVHRYEIAATPGGKSTVSYRYRITRISRLIGPLRLLKSPLAFAVRALWKAVTRKGLRNLIAVAESATHS